MYDYLIKSSYGNDSVALIQWAHEHDLENVAVLYNDTGWAHPEWLSRVAQMEDWASALGFHPHRTKSIGLEELVRKKKGWPRQGMQFCTAELKMAPTKTWMDENDPFGMIVSLIGVRREESRNRASFPEWSTGQNGETIWAPLVSFTSKDRDELLIRASIDPISTRSKECWPCINSNRGDLLDLNEIRIKEIEDIETSLGFTSKGNPRTMFRPYRYMGATGIREIVRWANSAKGEFNLDDGEGSSGCEAGWCGL